MKDIIKLSIITPEKQFYNGDVVEVITENENSRLGILPNHIAMITTLSPTETKLKQVDGKELKAFTSIGVLKVEDNKVTLLCDACEWPDDIDVKRAEESKKRAEMRLKQNSGVDYKRAEIALTKALMRLKIKNI